MPISSEWTTKRLPELGIQFSYPASWHLQDHGHSVGLATMYGALISNVDHGFEHPDLRDADTSVFDMRGLPDGLVALSFEQFNRYNPIANKETGLPLSLDYARIPIDADPYGAGLLHDYISFRAAGYPRSSVEIHISDITEAERAAIDRILASVKPIP
ncbi:MAG: hypothetical protein GEU71_07440 [Actinobacteria bacterium]|nr:hypothetical protein [Actinomycetota bacterium]